MIIIRFFRSLVFWVFLAFSIIFLGGFLPLFSFPFKNKKDLYQSSASFFSRLLLILSGIKTKVNGSENLKLIDPDKGLILAANHASFIDSYLLLAKLPFPFRFTVYQAGFRLPFLRNIYRGAGYIGVGPMGIRSVRHLATLLEAIKGKEKILIYSKVSKEEDKVEFSRGLIQLSNQFGIPILPVAIRGAARVLPMQRFLLGSGNITLSLGKPSFFTSPEELKEITLKLHASFS